MAPPWRVHRIVIRSVIALAALVAAGCVAGGRPSEQPAAQQQPRARAELALRAGRVLDPVAGRYDESAVILVRNGRISDVIPAREYRADVADSVVDLSQLTVLPGLIDGHVHRGCSRLASGSVPGIPTTPSPIAASHSPAP